MDRSRVPILNLKVSTTTYQQVSEQICKWILNKESRYVCVANVHMVMEAFDNRKYTGIINSADMTVPDGRPLVWAQKLLDHKNASQVRGSDLMLHICKEAEKRQFPVGLYGGTNEALNGFQGFLEKQYPNLQIACTISPSFRKLSKKEDEKDIKAINSSGAKILFVGLGCPKQEYWMAEHKGKINCIMIGIGAAFDFFGGTKKQAPKLMQQTGTEWLFRLATEPGRLWKRYLKHNPRFVYYFLKQFFSKKTY